MKQKRLIGDTYINIFDYISEDQIAEIITEVLRQKIVDEIDAKSILKLMENRRRQKILVDASNGVFASIEPLEMKEPQDQERKYYVYVLINDDWGKDGEIFYVGKGTGCRCNDRSNRSQQVTAILSKYNCHSSILFQDLTEEEAYQKEYECKQKFKLLGCPIIDAEFPGRLAAQRAGIKRAKEAGKYKGRKKIEVPNFGEHYDRYMRREITKCALAEELNISRMTLDRIIKEYKQGGICDKNDNCATS